MGEQQLDQVTSDELVRVPVSEFRRLLDAALPPVPQAPYEAQWANSNSIR